MRIDFYQLSRDPVIDVVPLLARKVLEAGQHLLIVDQSAETRAALSESLWKASSVFLANGEAGEAHQERQPILLSSSYKADNNATIALISDGIWDEQATSFERVLLLFDGQASDTARDLWRSLTAEKTHELHIFKQRENGAWAEGA